MRISSLKYANERQSKFEGKKKKQLGIFGLGGWFGVVWEIVPDGDGDSLKVSYWGLDGDGGGDEERGWR